MPDEFGLIAGIRRFTRNDRRVRLGIGDDAAVLAAPAGKELLLTTDMLVENRHFRLREASAYDIGRKALAVNLSDIAAMGGEPTHCVVAVGLPASKTGRFARELYRGIRDLARRFRVNVVGGDTNASDRVVVSVAMLGEAPRGKAYRRAAAKPGDRVFVTGTLGNSYRSGKHLRFTPRLDESRWLRKNARVHAMMDLSDGLASDLRRIAEESGVGFLIEEKALPLARGADTRMALSDGEDFELLFTAPPGESAKLRRRFHEIGRVVEKKGGIYLLGKNGTKKIIRGGWKHFEND